MGAPSHQIVRGGRVLGAPGPARAGFADLLIAGETIAAIGPPGLAAPAGALEIDARDRLLIPGLVNAHTHGDGTLAKGLGDRWSLELLLSAGPVTGGLEDAEAKYLAAKLGAVEMAMKGATACWDLFSEFPAPTVEGLHAVARAYAEVGVRAVVAPLMADRNFWQAIPGLRDALPGALGARVDALAAAPAAVTLAAAREAATRWPFDRARVRPALCPTIPHHCADSFFVACRDLAGELDLRVHTHLGESKVQAVVGLTKYGESLTAHLDRLGVLGPRFTAAHGVWLDDADIARLADRGASLAHNPTSNLRLGVGIAPVHAMRRAGLTLGLGTDGSTCSDGLNMFEAARMAALASRARSPDPDDWLDADAALALATTGGAATLGFGDSIGRLTPGAQADIVFLRLDRPEYWPLNDAPRQVVFLETGAGVDRVMVGGRTIVERGECVSVDMGALRRDVERLRERLDRANADAARLVAALEPVVGRFCVGLARVHHPVEGYAGGPSHRH